MSRPEPPMVGGKQAQHVDGHFLIRSPGGLDICRMIADIGNTPCQPCSFASESARKFVVR